MFNFFKKKVNKKEENQDFIQILGMMLPLIFSSTQHQDYSSRCELELLREKYHELDKRLMLQESKACKCSK